MELFVDRLFSWYKSQGRKLPWRDSTDPYTVWVSEIMLQQTRVETVISYFERWMQRFPTIAELAAASEQEVLSVWEGLGYYSRARNLHKAAGIVNEHYGGELPEDLEKLRDLPGIGRYTAGAIASMAFGQDQASLDANIRRVLARIFNVSEPADSAAGEDILWRLAEEHLPKGRAGEYNQALMDLGAIICSSKKPRCLFCPLSDMCQAYQHGIQEQRPVLKPKPDVPHYIVTAAVIRRNGKLLLARRPSKGLLGGMWEFPGGKLEKGEMLEGCLAREIREELGADITVDEPFGVYQHAYTHFRITLHAFLCELTGSEPNAIQAAEITWTTPAELHKFPMGKVDRQIAHRLVLRENGE